MQRSISDFTSRRALTPDDEAYRRRLDLQRKEAERLSLKWPLVVVRPVGRPSMKAKWRYALIRALQDKPESVAAVESSTTPPWWWRGGMAVDAQPAAVLEPVTSRGQPAVKLEQDPDVPMVEETGGPAVKQEPELEEAVTKQEEPKEPLVKEEQQEEPSRKKRKYYKPPPEAKAWFLEFAEEKKRLKGWNMQESLRYAQGMAPELFQDVNEDSIYKWTVGAGGVETRGRRPALSALAIQKLASVASQLGGVIPLSASAFMDIFHEQLKDMGTERELGLRWTQGFLRQLNMTYRQSSGSLQKQHDQARKQKDVQRGRPCNQIW